MIFLFWLIWRYLHLVLSINIITYTILSICTNNYSVDFFYNSAKCWHIRLISAERNIYLKIHATNLNRKVAIGPIFDKIYQNYAEKH